MSVGLRRPAWTVADLVGAPPVWASSSAPLHPPPTLLPQAQILSFQHATFPKCGRARTLDPPLLHLRISLTTWWWFWFQAPVRLECGVTNVDLSWWMHLSLGGGTFTCTRYLFPVPHQKKTS